MIFYLCQTPEGPKLAPTQADAKALDKGFKQVDVPTDKANLLAYVNDLFAKAHGLRQTVTVDANEFLSENEPIREATVNVSAIFIDGKEVAAINAKRPTFLGALTGAEIEQMRHRQGNCPKCGTNPSMRLTHDRMAVDQFIERADVTTLDAVDQSITWRREEIDSEAKRAAEAAKPKALPVARVRQRARAEG